MDYDVYDLDSVQILDDTQTFEVTGEISLYIHTNQTIIQLSTDTQDEMNGFQFTFEFIGEVGTIKLVVESVKC